MSLVSLKLVQQAARHLGTLTLVPSSSISVRSMVTRVAAKKAQTENTSSINNTNNDNADNPPLVITERCAQRLKEVAGPNECLRILVESGGCSGFEYKFSLISEPPAQDDRVVERNGARVVIDSTSLDLLRGSTLDYERELIRAAFRIVKNPNAEQGCSCGASFALKMPAL